MSRAYQSRKINISLDQSFFPYLILFFGTIIITGISLFVINAYPLKYDLGFHLARIVGLAQSIKNGDWLPNLNNLFSYGTGYASPMFYGNWQLYLPALTYLITENTAIAYSTLGFLTISLVSWSTFYVMSKLTSQNSVSLLVALIVPCFFPAHGFGMTMVIGLVPLLIYSLYQVLIANKTNPILLAVVIALLIQTHLISTLILA